MSVDLRHQIFLAALLHDIGKFYQRADKPFSDKYSELSPYSKRIAEDICPIGKNGQFGYQHVVWTNEFLEKERNVIENVPGIKSNLHSNENGDDSMASFASNHHRPKTELQALVTLADWWSAGIDRTNPDTLEKDSLDNAAINWGRERYKKIPLYSIFNKLNGGNYSSAFGLNPLNIDSGNFFPKNVTSSSEGEDQSKYKSLWDKFVEEFAQLPTDSFGGFAESLTYLLKKYTWCIPSNTMDMADVSLYEHLKTTAAFADCFYQYHEENPGCFKWDGTRLSIEEGSKPVILLGGDISGIQNFIYNVSSKKAAVSLKGRSFYLQLLVDSVIQRIISHQAIDATIAQVVYSSGGKFYMLLPNTKKVREAIADLRVEFENWLWKEHRGGLLLNMDYVPFAFDCKSKNVTFDGADDSSKVGDLWRVLAEKLASCKNVRFKSVLQKDAAELFNPQEVSADDRVCAVTGVEGKCENIGNSGTDAVWVLPSVKKQCELGEVLKDADYIITYKTPDVSKLFKNKWTFDIDILGVHTYLFDKLELINENAEFRGISSADVCRVKCINSLLIPQLKGKSCSYGFQFYGGNKQAVTSYGNNKTFEELADGEYLGILRMDVDNLGAIFIKGLPEASKSFAAYSTLSFMLDWFFSGYLNTIRDRKEFKDSVNILYSGGDDVFAIGKWDQIILFAEAIRKDFAKFVGREDISISAGITIVDPKYPIAKAAQLAGEAEDDAKKFEGSGLMKKNSLNMFGENISWQKEFDVVKQYKDKFIELVNKENMPKAILHRIMTLCQKMKEGDMSYMWHTAYYLKRVIASNKNSEVIGFCNTLKKELCDRRKYELVATAARWAEIQLRK
jgi:CRISPR-associated protein Csm1